MNGLATSQLDIFLNFSELHLLVFSSRWKLMDLRPTHHNFLGWDETTLDAFDFLKNFLQPNHLTLQEFLGHFRQKDYVIRNYFWQDVSNQISGPYQTHFRIKKEKGQIKSLMAFVKLSENTDKIEIAPHQKYNIFISKYLPGLIHNLNGPLGTITGRIELLNYKYKDIKEFDELMKMGYRLQSVLENLSFKLVNERYERPVEINLNRLLREEIDFLNADLFFKHQVEKKSKFTPNIPEFRMYYLALSGVLSESFYFFRNFMEQEQEYVFHYGSFCENGEAGFYIKFLGNFITPENSTLRFPFLLEGDAVNMVQEELDGIDTAFLSYCLKKNRGKINLSGRKEMLSMELTFPLPGEA